MKSTLQRTNTGNKYSQKRNCVAAVPIPHSYIYIIPRSICTICCRKYVDTSWKYINWSQTNKCGNWDWGPTIPRKGIHKWDLRCNVNQMHHQHNISSQLTANVKDTCDQYTAGVVGTILDFNRRIIFFCLLRKIKKGDKGIVKGLGGRGSWKRPQDLAKLSLY